MMPPVLCTLVLYTLPLHDQSLTRRSAVIQVIVGNRLREILPDRYFTTTIIWSLRQQAVVAEFKGYIVLLNFSTGRPVNLLESGEPYKKLHAQIKAKAEKSNELLTKWERRHQADKEAAKKTSKL